MKSFKALISALLIFLIAEPIAYAGDSQVNDPVLSDTQVISFSSKIEQALAERSAYIAIVGRPGRPPSDLPDGVRYTHMGFWIYSEFELPDGTLLRGYRVHALYQLAERLDVSRLVEDMPTDFVAGAVRPEQQLSFLRSNFRKN